MYRIKDDKLLTLSKEELELGYRTSAVMKKNYIVLSAKFKLEDGNLDSIKNINTKSFIDSCWFKTKEYKGNFAVE